jgi:hypothetical protein
MAKLTLVEPEVGTKNSVADPRIPTALKAIEKVINGEIEGTNNLEAEGVKEANLEKALQEKIAAKVSGLEIAGHAVSFEAKSGELCELNGEGITATLPAATANRLIGFYQGVGGTTTINASSKGFKIYGDFVKEANSVGLTQHQHLWLFATGGRWVIVAGECKREQAYGALTGRAVGTEYEPSITRETEVMLSWTGLNPAKGMILEIGGIPVTRTITTETGLISFRVGAGVKWKMAAPGGPTATVETSYRTL